VGYAKNNSTVLIFLSTIPRVSHFLRLFNQPRARLLVSASRYLSVE